MTTVKMAVLATLVMLATLAPQASYAQSMREQTRDDYVAGFAPILLTWSVVSVASVVVLMLRDYNAPIQSTPPATLHLTPMGVTWTF